MKRKLGLPWSSVVKTPHFHCGSIDLILAKELGSCRAQGTPKNREKRKRNLANKI